MKICVAKYITGHRGLSYVVLFKETKRRSQISNRVIDTAKYIYSLIFFSGIFEVMERGQMRNAEAKAKGGMYFQKEE